MLADFLTESRRVATLAVPLALAQLVQMGMAFVDTVMVGRLGGSELAGMALAATIYTFVTIFLHGLIFSVGPLVSHAFGSGRYKEAGAAARGGLWLALLTAAPAAVLLANASPLLAALGQQPGSVAIADDYLKAAAWGFVPSVMLVALRAFLEGVGDTRPILALMSLGLAANIVFDEVLMFGRLGLPALGVAGTGYATSLVQTIMLLMAFLYVVKVHRGFGVLVRLLPDTDLLRQLVRLGLPISLTVGFEAGLFNVTAILMGLLGEAALAAHQVALQSASMTFTLAVGLSVASSVRVGQLLGAGDESGARRAGLAGLSLAVLVMSGTACLFWLAPRSVVSVYLDLADPANAVVVESAVLFLGIAATFQVFDGIQVCAAGVLRGYKDTTVPMLISLFSYWFVGIGSGSWLAFGLGWGGRGLWTGLVLGLGCAAILLVLRFRWRSRNRGVSKGRMAVMLGRR